MIAGVVADAHNRRRVMLVTQSAAALVALSLAFTTWHGVDALWPIYALAACGGGVNAFDLPARQSLVPTLVAKLEGILDLERYGAGGDRVGVLPQST